jgi:hypothetical protein
LEWNSITGDIVRIYSDLSVDPIIGDQGIIIREFMDLEVVEEGVSQPFFNEWRFFFYEDQMLSNGFYWTCSEKMGQPIRTLIGQRSIWDI